MLLTRAHTPDRILIMASSPILLATSYFWSHAHYSPLKDLEVGLFVLNSVAFVFHGSILAYLFMVQLCASCARVWW